MNKIIIILLLACFSVSAQNTIILTEHKAFPSALGYGKNAVGGRSGNVIKVSNVTELRAAITATGARTIVFEEGGIYDLGGTDVKLGDGYVSILGQTAPSDSDGVFIYGGEIESNGKSHIIMRHLKIRGGDQIINTGMDAVRIINTTNSSSNVGNIIIDHCDIGWGDDETLSFGGNSSLGRTLKNITVQYTLIHEAFGGDKGMLFGDQMVNVTITRNVYTNSKERNPRSAYGYVNVEIVNNVMYGNGYPPVSLTWSMVFDVIGNWHKTNSYTLSSKFLEFTQSANNGTFPIGQTRAYVEGNTINGADADRSYSGNLGSYFVSSRLNDSGLPLLELTGNALKEHIIDNVGSLHRDDITQGQLDDIDNSTGGFPKSEAQAGFATLPTYASGTPETDTDNDGIPDSFETAHGLTGDGTNITTNWDFGTYTVVNHAGYYDREIYWAWRANDFAQLENQPVEPVLPVHGIVQLQVNYTTLLD